MRSIISGSLYGIVLLLSFLFISTEVFPQSANVEKSVKASSAFSEILLKETEFRSELESLLADYTEEFPKIKELRYSLSLAARDKSQLLKTKTSELDRLSLALGKLLVRRIELETELWRVSQTYADSHPDVRRAKKKVEVFDQAIKEILG